MNAKQIKIQKKIGEHIAALHSLYEEFERAGDDSQDSRNPLEEKFPDLPPEQREDALKKCVAEWSKEAKDKNPAA